MSDNQKRAKRRIGRSRLWRRVKKLLKGLALIALMLIAGLFGLKAYIASQAVSDGGETAYFRAIVQSGAMSDTV